MQAPVKVAILLSTFNGEKYLVDQLDSLIHQSYSNFVIVLRDDNSTDGTTSLIQSYRRKFPELIHVIENKGENLGASGSYSLLMRYVLDHKRELGLQQAYMMFCDQDDVWLEDKTSVQIKAMLDAESRTASIPTLIHSDLRVVSESGEQISESFMQYQGLKTERNHFGNLLVSNLVTGCTVLLNESLAKLVLPIPKEAIMHDWWAALVGSAFGNIIFLDSPLVNYRQHENNTLGAKQYQKPNYSGNELIRKILSAKPNPLLEDCATQSRAFRNRYDDQLNNANRFSTYIAATMSFRIGIFQQLIFRLLRRF